MRLCVIGERKEKVMKLTDKANGTFDVVFMASAKDRENWILYAAKHNGVCTWACSSWSSPTAMRFKFNFMNKTDAQEFINQSAEKFK